MGEPLPIEPGWYLVLSTDVGEVETWGPRLAGVHRLDRVLLALQMAGLLAGDDEPALAQLAAQGSITYPGAASGPWGARAARLEGLVEIERTGRGLTVTVRITELGRLTLAVAAALRRPLASSGRRQGA